MTVAALATAVVLSCLQPAAAQRTTDAKWEYAVLSWQQVQERGVVYSWYSFTPDRTERRAEGDLLVGALNHLGDEGWQLVTSGTNPPYRPDTYILMRPAR